MDMSPKAMAAMLKANHAGRFIKSVDPQTEVVTFQVVHDTQEALAKFKPTDGVTGIVGKPDPKNKLGAADLHQLAIARGFTLKLNSMNVKRSTTAAAIEEKPEWANFRKANPDYKSWFVLPGSRGQKESVENIDDVLI